MTRILSACMLAVCAAALINLVDGKCKLNIKNTSQSQSERCDLHHKYNQLGEMK